MEFGERLQLLGVQCISCEAADDALETLSLLYFLVHLTTLPNERQFLQALSAGVVTPNWASDSLQQVFLRAKKKSEAMFRKIVPVAFAITQRVTKKRVTAPLQLVTFPGSCLFDVMEAGAEGANNAVVEAYVYGETVEEGSRHCFIPYSPHGSDSTTYNVPLHTVAVKILSKDSIMSKGKYAKARCIEEIEIAMKMCHSSVIRTFHSCEAFNLLFLIMEYADRGDLVNAIRQCGSFSEAHARHTFTQILSALTYLHKTFIIHRDIKPENVLLQSVNEDSCYSSSVLGSQALLADFGAAVDMSKHNRKLLHGTVGTMAYAAPEILGGMPYKPEPVDIWSLGVVLFAMIFGKLPWSFENKTIKEAYMMLASEPCIIPTERHIHGAVSHPCRDLIGHLIRIDPVVRLTLKQIWNHPWISCKPGLTRCVLPRLNHLCPLDEQTCKRGSHVAMTSRTNRFSLFMKNDKECQLARSFSMCQATTMSSGGWSQGSYSKHGNGVPYLDSRGDNPHMSCDLGVNEIDRPQYVGENKPLESERYTRINVTKVAQTAAHYLATAAIDFIGGWRTSRRPPPVDVTDLEQQNLVSHYEKTNFQHLNHSSEEEVVSTQNLCERQYRLMTTRNVHDKNIAIPSTLMPSLGRMKIPPLNLSVYHAKMGSPHVTNRTSHVIYTQRDSTDHLSSEAFFKNSTACRTERSHPYSSHTPLGDPVPLSSDYSVPTSYLPLKYKPGRFSKNEGSVNHNGKS